MGDQIAGNDGTCVLSAVVSFTFRCIVYIIATLLFQANVYCFIREFQLAISSANVKWLGMSHVVSFTWQKTYLLFNVNIKISPWKNGS